MNQKLVTEPSLYLWCMVWLHKAELAQTPHEDLVLQLTDRYYALAKVLHLFKGFDFVPRTPAKQLVL